MGQSSSASSKKALPAKNLLIDASDSYVTELKLRSTDVIPISEYIKKDKFSKNLRLQKKNNTPQVQEGNKSKDKDETSYKFFTIKEKKTSRATSTASIKKEKKLFIESSFEDIPSKRKWINPNNPQYYQSKSTDRNHHKNQKTQTIKNETKVEKGNDIHGIRSSSSEEIRQLYKNRIYPHIYKNKYNRNVEQKQKETHNKGTPPKFEEGTHQLNQHHYHQAKPANTRPKQNKLSVQTNIACVIRPDRRRHVISVSSEEIIRRRPPPRKCFTSPADSSSFFFQRKDNSIDTVTKEHRKYLSAKQALENWKNIHTIKQHRKNSNTSYNNYQDDIYRNYNRLPCYGERNVEYFPSRHFRSRAGSREGAHKMSPLEVSNYNYSKQPKYFKIGCISPTEIKKPNQNMQQRVFRECMPEYNRLESPRYDYMDNTSYGSYLPTYNKYPNYEEEKHFYRHSPRPAFSEREERAMEREDFIADMERCLQKKIASVYCGRNMDSSRTTWVQDKHRRWHKISV